jgi:hypothetical protein
MTVAQSLSVLSLLEDYMQVAIYNTPFYTVLVIATKDDAIERLT